MAKRYRVSVGSFGGKPVFQRLMSNEMKSSGMKMMTLGSVPDTQTKTNIAPDVSKTDMMPDLFICQRDRQFFAKQVT